MMDELATDPRPLVSVVVPAYNEALKLMGSLTAIYSYLGTLHDRYRFELLVVDDGSRDGSAEAVDMLTETLEQAKTLGLANVARRALSALTEAKR